MIQKIQVKFDWNVDNVAEALKEALK